MIDLENCIHKKIVKINMKKSRNNAQELEFNFNELNY